MPQTSLVEKELPYGKQGTGFGFMFKYSSPREFSLFTRFKFFMCPLLV